MASLADYSDVELLVELVRRNGCAQAPVKQIRTPDHSETIIGIGRNHSANIILDNEALIDLRRICGDE